MRILENLLFGFSILLLLIELTALAFWEEMDPYSQVLVIFASSSALMGNYAGYCIYERLHLCRRKRKWQRSMAFLHLSAKTEAMPGLGVVNSLSDGAIRSLAAQMCRKMGYEIVDTGTVGAGDHIIKCVNPNGKVELVQVKPKGEQTGLASIRGLGAVMEQEKAVQCMIWAPGGFSSEAAGWAQDKSIFLANSGTIDQMINFSNRL